MRREQRPAVLSREGGPQASHVEILMQPRLYLAERWRVLKSCTDELEQLWRCQVPQPLFVVALCLHPEDEVCKCAGRQVRQRRGWKCEGAGKERPFDAGCLLEARECIKERMCPLGALLLAEDCSNESIELRKRCVEFVWKLRDAFACARGSLVCRSSDRGELLLRCSICECICQGTLLLVAEGGRAAASHPSTGKPTLALE
mmetsp:Transcript_42574/g.85440  ORF Transcript_42574/g.85440 Transcript_42574/m.85440 type:complete len:202 (+) Transcript_42574:391-996(+)